jgi:hypothetical protein
VSVPHLSLAPGRLDLDRLSAADREAYYAGDWLAAHPVKSEDLGPYFTATDAEMAAEMLARIRVELEHADDEREQA